MDPDSWAWAGDCSRDCSHRHAWGQLSRIVSLLFALSKSPSLLLLTFIFHLSSIIWLAQNLCGSLLHFFSSSASFCTITAAFPASVHDCDIASAGTAYHNLPLTLGSALSRTALPFWDPGWSQETPVSTQVDSSPKLFLALYETI